MGALKSRGQGLGLYIPGELSRQKMGFRSPSTVYASPHNPGALEVAVALANGMGHSVRVTSDANAVFDVFLLYLNDQTYLGAAGSRLAAELHAARDAALGVVMVHENDPRRGGTPFATFFHTVRDALASGRMLRLGRFLLGPTPRVSGCAAHLHSSEPRSRPCAVADTTRAG